MTDKHRIGIAITRRVAGWPAYTWEGWWPLVEQAATSDNRCAWAVGHFGPDEVAQ